MTLETRQKAIIYTRVASTTKMLGGPRDATAWQEARCRAHTQERGYDLVAVFEDRGFSASSFRPSLENLLAWLAEHQGEQVAVIVDDIGRLARDMVTYVEIRDAITKTGATIEGPGWQFGRGASEVLAENLFTAMAQHQEEEPSPEERGLVMRVLSMMRRERRL